MINELLFVCMISVISSFTCMDDTETKSVSLYNYYVNKSGEFFEYCPDGNDFIRITDEEMLNRLHGKT